MSRSPYSPFLAGVATLAAFACGDSGTNNPDPTPDTTPASVTIVSGDNQTAEVNTALGAALVVRVANAANEPLNGKTIDWSVQAGGGTLGSMSSSTNATGTTQTTYSVGGTAGANQVRATVQEATQLTATFSATATEPPDLTPAAIMIVSGDNQSATAGEALPDALVVRVANSADQGLQGVMVNWTVNLGGGTLGASTSITNAAGEASNTYTVGASAGANEIEAAVASTPQFSTLFTATATPVPSAVAVAVTNNMFNPMDAVLAAGGTVTWNFNQGMHNVTWVSGGFADSGNKSSGTHQVNFANTGTFDYYCSIHGSPGAGMHGSVQVQ